MHKFYFNRLGLCEEASELGSTPAIAGASSPAPVAVPVPAVEAAAAPGLIDGAIAMFKDKGALQAEIASLKAEIGKSKATISERDTAIIALTAERDAALSKHEVLNGEFGRLDVALKAALAVNKDVAVEVTHQLAAAGVPEAALPVASSTAAPATKADKLASLQAKIDATTDPKERGRLAQEQWDLE